MENRIISGERQPIPPLIKKLYLLGFRAGITYDTVAFPVFWWELHLRDRDAAEALNGDVACELEHTVKI